MRASEPLHLLKLKDYFQDCSYHQAKPCRIYMKVYNVSVQLFPRGCIQILGNVSEDQCLKIWEYLTKHLHPIKVSKPRTKSVTVQCQWAPPTNLNKMDQLPSTSRISNEKELFPGTLINYPRVIRQRVHNYHCALFNNGIAIVTGVTSISEAEKCFNNAYVNIFIPSFNLKFSKTIIRNGISLLYKVFNISKQVLKYISIIRSQIVFNHLWGV